MNRDPIMDSSPVRLLDAGRRAPTATYDSEDDSGDELFDEHFTEATIPISSSYFQKRTLNAPTQPTFTTQPTQLLDTPKKQTQSIVQVVASSPHSDQVSSPSPKSNMAQRRPNIMAPPGTYLNAPIPYQPPPIPFDSDDPPIEISSDEEVTMRSNIKPSTFRSTKGQSSSSRVEETPQKRSVDFSSFAYEGPQKRKVDDMASAYAVSRKKARPQPSSRQTGPAKAQPVPVDIDLDDIPDMQVRRKVERLKGVFPDKTISELQDALAVKKGQYSDALDYISEMEDRKLLSESEDELSKTPQNVKPVPRKTAEKTLDGPTQSIQQRYSHLTQHVSAPVSTQRKLAQPVQSIQQKYSHLEPEATVQPKKRRLMQGRKNRSPTPEIRTKPRQLPPPPKSVLQAEKQRQKPIVIDSDEEEEEAPESDSDDSGNEALPRAGNSRLLDFFNVCSVEEMIDLSNQTADIVEYVLSKRPFRSLDDVEEVTMLSEPSVTAKGRARKPVAKKVGEKLFNYAERMWDGYQAVDELVEKCEAMGRPITQAMKKWGVDVFGAAREGELALSSLDDIKSESSARDSGIGTPRSPLTIDDGDGDVVSQLDRSKAKFLKQPSIMSADMEMKDYQVVGLNWLNLLWTHGMSGILADDMGLGKTCQVISFLSHLREKGVKGPHLVIGPATILENWLQEFKKFSPELVVEPYYGSDRMAHQIRILNRIGEIDVIVSTYDQAYKGPDSKFLRSCKPQVCIFDEGHLLKSPGSKRYMGLMKVKAEMRLFLTGTPLQNNLQELTAVLAFIMPDLFEKRKEDLDFVFKHKAKTTDEQHSALLSEERVSRARLMMAPFILRRKKEQTLKDLPEKTCRVEYCELLPAQKRIYNRFITRQRKILEDRAAGKEVTDHANVMMRLRQAAIHPFLFREIYDDKIRKKIYKTCMATQWKHEDPELIKDQLDQFTDYDFHQLTVNNPKALGQYALDGEEWMNSGKVAKLAELLDKYIKNGDRTLIFSQFTTVMDILQLVLSTLDIAYMRIDGSTPVADRQSMLDVWTQDETCPVFLLSTKAGGTGINLTAANKVIIFDSGFNPQEDIQAENRAHRVGQTRPVEVVRLVTKGTIEEQIYALGQSKLKLDNLVTAEKSEEKAIEKKGIDTVADMLLNELNKKDEGDDDDPKQEEAKEEQDDLKDQFLHKLKKSGLDVSAS